MPERKPAAKTCRAVPCELRRRSPFRPRRRLVFLGGSRGGTAKITQVQPAVVDVICEKGSRAGSRDALLQVDVFDLSRC